MNSPFKAFIFLRTLGGEFMYDVNYNTSSLLAPSSHEMRYKTFLGSMNLKTQKMRKWRRISVESGKYECGMV
jgi:hypothetical protein